MTCLKSCTSSEELLGSPPCCTPGQPLMCMDCPDVDCGPMCRPDPCYKPCQPCPPDPCYQPCQPDPCYQPCDPCPPPCPPPCPTYKSPCCGGFSRPRMRSQKSICMRSAPVCPCPCPDDEQYMEGCRRIGDHSYRLWKDQMLCDVIIKCCGGDEVKAHKTVLSTYSEFMVENFSQFPDGEAISIDLPEFSIDIVMLILHFVYTQEVDINTKTVGPLLKCADELGICELVRMCVEYLSCVCVDNAVYFYAIADNYGLSELKERIYRFIVDNFLEISTTKHFYYLHPDRLLALLADDRLRVHNELEVFNAAVCWMDHCRPERLPYAPVILQCGVRLLCISPECLVTKVECVCWIFEIPENQAILNDAIRYHALKLSGSRLANAYPKQKARGGCY